jgi:hypothetical protein
LRRAAGRAFCYSSNFPVAWPYYCKKRGVKMMLNIIYKMAVKVLSGASPEIRNQIKAFLSDLEEKAKQTSNPVDDILVLCLRILLGF